MDLFARIERDSSPARCRSAGSVDQALFCVRITGRSCFQICPACLAPAATARRGMAAARACMRAKNRRIWGMRLAASMSGVTGTLTSISVGRLTTVPLGLDYVELGGVVVQAALIVDLLRREVIGQTLDPPDTQSRPAGPA